MIYTLLIVLIIALVAVLVWLRARYIALLDYTRQSDTERIALAEELQTLKDESDFINFIKHG
jgi:hypothetical protein